jgi:hypothetical protein
MIENLNDEINRLSKERGGLVGMAFEIMIKNIGETSYSLEDRTRTYNTAKNWLENIPGNYPIIHQEIEERYKRV